MHSLPISIRAAFVLLFIAVQLFGADSGTEIPKNGYINRQLYPKAYGVLSSDHLMFPVDVSNWPLRIDSRRQLFVDDYLIASMDNIRRQWHQPEKHQGNPVMSGKLPWEGDWIIPLRVCYDSDTRKFRLWYTSRIRYTEPGGTVVRFPTLYAESDDGLKWYRPALGILEYDDVKENNFLIHGGAIRGMFENPNPTQADKRYTALVMHEPEYVEQEGYFIYTSPDGIHWTGDRKRMVLPSLQNYTMPQTGIGDTSIFRYDPVLGLYVCDVKFVLPGKMRCRGQCESEDLIHWSRPRFTLYPDEHDGADAQVYSNISFVYESMWLGLCRIMHTERTGWKQVEVQLSMSRDGYHWTRPTERKPFIPFGGPDSWEPDYTDPIHNGPIRLGDELWFYYRGSRHRNRDNNPGAWKYSSMSMGLAKLRRDGFASLNAGDNPGVVLTRPLTFSGRSLFVNAEVSKGGWVKAAVLTRAGKGIASYELDKSVPLQQDTTRGRMIWKDKDAQNLMPPQNEHVRLMFQLKNAKLYAFWVE